jgi:hydroxymethylbilane synthase
MIGSVTLRLGTRASRLARAQAAIVAQALGSTSEVAVELVEISTRGDAISAARPRGGYEAADGQFTAELERAVLDGRVGLAVHSFKDLPTMLTPGLSIAAILERADPRDCLLSRFPGGLAGLPPRATVGTSSPRRATQLLAARPDLVPRPIRGNVETRIARMERGEYDAVLLACAGLDRLGIAVPEEARLPLDLVLPAPAQGALAVQVRTEEDGLIGRLAAIDHRPTRIAADAERALLNAIGGGCLAPLAAFGEVDGEGLRLRAVHAPAPEAVVRVDVRGAAGAPDTVVAEAARRILAAPGAMA